MLLTRFISAARTPSATTATAEFRAWCGYARGDSFSCIFHLFPVLSCLILALATFQIMPTKCVLSLLWVWLFHTLSIEWMCFFVLGSFDLSEFLKQSIECTWNIMEPWRSLLVNPPLSCGCHSLAGSPHSDAKGEAEQGMNGIHENVTQCPVYSDRNLVGAFRVHMNS